MIYKFRISSRIALSLLKCLKLLTIDTRQPINAITPIAMIPTLKILINRVTRSKGPLMASRMPTYHDTLWFVNILQMITGMEDQKKWLKCLFWGRGFQKKRKDNLNEKPAETLLIQQ